MRLKRDVQNNMKNLILEELRNVNGYVSGQSLGQKLNISRAAVWKHIKSLQKEGYVIQSVTNQGYMFISPPEKLNEAEISRKLKCRVLGKKIYSYELTDSTNMRARAKGYEGESEGAVFVAEEQNAGRGRLGRSWEAKPGDGVYVSVLLRPKIPPDKVMQITLLAGLAVFRTLREISGIPCMIKWPNDIVCDGKKLCGILTEMSSEAENIDFLVTGIGININNESFPESISNLATSVFLETGLKQNRLKILCTLLENFESLYIGYLASPDFTPFLDEYKAACVTLGKEVEIHYFDKTEKGFAAGISEKGELLVNTEKGQISVNSGEVSLHKSI